MTNKKLPVSAVIVSYNEGYLLEKSLPPLLFCDQIIVVNLQSTDNTIEVATKFGAEVWEHNKVPVVEIIHKWIIDKVKHDWLLITDPDELLSEELKEEIITFFPNISKNIGSVSVPLQFYFNKNKLQGTPWGGPKNRVYLLNRNRFYFTENVHLGRQLKANFKDYTIPFSGKNLIHHYWMQNYNQLFEKHIRYLKKEGKSRYNSSIRTNLIQVLKTPFREFHNSFIQRKGYLDGITGLFLSFFWSWYQTMALWELLKYQYKVQSKKNKDS
jgi:glycosyltransferase involved in cell wall biosynthesis